VVKTATREKESSDKELVFPDGSVRVWRSPAREEGLRIGTVVHQIMEEVDLQKGRADESLVRAAAEAAGLGDKADEILLLVNNLLASAPLQRAAASGSAQHTRSAEAAERVSRSSGFHVMCGIHRRNEGTGHLFAMSKDERRGQDPSPPARF
jgi:hypothetical protein